MKNRSLQHSLPTTPFVYVAVKLNAVVAEPNCTTAVSFSACHATIAAPSPCRI